MIILGFGSKARQGKDTAGEVIQHYYTSQAETARKHGLKHQGPRVSIVKFASALYKEAKKLHGMTDKDPVLLQNLGMTRRQEDPEYWIKKAFARIPQSANIVVFTDVRFLNEAAAIKKAGGHLIQVSRLNQDGSQYYATDRPSNHPSETELDSYNWDHYIKTKNAAETGEQAITICEFIRGLESK